MRTRTILRKAKQYILANGWHQGNFRPDNSEWGDGGPRCVMGAIAEVSGGTMSDDYIRVLYVLKNGLEGVWLSAARFNDAETTTKKDVIKLLERFAR